MSMQAHHDDMTDAAKPYNRPAEKRRPAGAMKATHELRYQGRRLFQCRLYQNGRTDMHCFADGQKCTTHSPSLQDEFKRGHWGAAIMHCFGRKLAEALPEGCSVVELATLPAVPVDAASLQRMINSGIAWRLEGASGRNAMANLELGNAMLGLQRQVDYWGNVVPSRHEVKAGTKGSFELVAETHGADYAEALGGIGADPLGYTFSE